MRVGSDIERIKYVDGLRGLAVLLVVIAHSLFFGVHDLLELDRTSPALALVWGLGSNGVSLFLVLSGFCLSLPLFRAQQSGDSSWFEPRRFFVKRFRRIVPLYYVALAGTLSLESLLGSRFDRVIGAHTGFSGIDWWSVVQHILLIHNNIRSSLFDIQSPFWSLGLEWQWYAVFPFILVAALHRPRLLLIAAATVAVIWSASTSLASAPGQGIGFYQLPARLFEFSCGVFAARALAFKHIPVSPLLFGVCIGTIACLIVPVLAGADPLGDGLRGSGVYGLVSGVGFASLVLLGHQWRGMNLVASCKPLVVVGIASYSIYLIHFPLIALSAMLVSTSTPLFLRFTVFVCAGTMGGLAFHIAVERPLLALLARGHKRLAQSPAGGAASSP